MTTMAHPAHDRRVIGVLRHAGAVDARHVAERLGIRETTARRVLARLASPSGPLVRLNPTRTYHEPALFKLRAAPAHFDDRPLADAFGLVPRPIQAPARLVRGVISPRDEEHALSME
jgi:hypothetical protein